MFMAPLYTNRSGIALSILRACISFGFMLWGVGAYSVPLILDTASYTDTTNTFFTRVNSLTVRGNSASSMTYDAAGRTLYFAQSAKRPVINIYPGKTLIIQNARLMGFRPEHVFLQSQSSQLLLGSNVVVGLEQDLDLATTLTFVGNASIDGRGKVLSLKNNAALVVGSKASLQIEDCVLHGVSNFTNFDGTAGTSLACGPRARIILNSVRCFFDSSWTFTAGALNILGDVSFSSTWATVSYTSGACLTIEPNSSLSFLRGITFVFASVAGKNKFVLSDSTSALCIKNSTLSSASIGLTLNEGALFLKGDVLFKNTAKNTASGITLGTTLCTALLSGSTLSIDGIVAHGTPSS